MRESITQEFDYGCGIACYAFALKITYRDACERLGGKQATSERFWVRDLKAALNAAGLHYSSRHIKANTRQAYVEGTIVLIRRSKRYPTGHYLILYDDYWMDPWINLAYNKDITQAQSGFRRRLPGSVMYALELCRE